MNENPYEVIYMCRMQDPAAFEILQKMYGGLLAAVTSRLISSYTPLEEYRDDLMQEALISLYEAVYSYCEGKSSFTTFLNLVVRRKQWNYIRKLNGKTHIPLHMKVTFSQLTTDETDFVTAVEQRDVLSDPVYCFRISEAMDTLDRTVSQMSEEEKTAIYSWMIGETYKKGSERLQLENTRRYEGLLNKARTKVHKALLTGERS